MEISHSNTFVFVCPYYSCNDEIVSIDAFLTRKIIFSPLISLSSVCAYVNEFDYPHLLLDLLNVNTESQKSVEQLHVGRKVMRGSYCRNIYICVSSLVLLTYSTLLT